MAITACNRKDNGVSPIISQSVEQGKKPTALLASVAPNPFGPNLALSAIATASDNWQRQPTYPQSAIDGNPDTGWASNWSILYGSYSHWFSLTWSQPQTFNRIFVYFFLYGSQNIAGIKYYNSSTQTYLPIPNTSYSEYLHLGERRVDFTFQPVTTTSIIVNFNADIACIREIEVYGGLSLKITQPINNTQFTFGDNIHFLATQTGNVTNIEWVDITKVCGFDQANVFGNGLSVDKNDLTIGTHTITLRGLIASTSISDSITIEVVAAAPQPATGSLKIISPATTEGLFASGENINFIGSQTGTVTNIEWVDNGVVFAHGLSASKSDLSPGSHTIALRWLSASNPYSDSITLIVIKSIKIKDFDTGQPLVEPFRMSSIRGIKKFQAIGCFDDEGNNEYGLVKVKWSLPDGDLDPTHTMRSQILTALGSNKRKIGVLAVPNGTDTQLLDSDTATFVSFFSGNITLKAEFRAHKLPHSVVAKNVSIALKQPTIYVRPTLIANVAPVLNLWLARANQTWGRDNILKVKLRATGTKTNEMFADMDVNSSEIYLPFTQPPEKPALINPITFDKYLDSFYPVNYVVPRQSKVLLSRPISSKDICAFVVDKLWINEKPSIVACLVLFYPQQIH